MRVTMAPTMTVEVAAAEVMALEEAAKVLTLKVTMGSRESPVPVEVVAETWVPTPVAEVMTLKEEAKVMALKVAADTWASMLLVAVIASEEEAVEL